ncbi:HAMP domain-containing protein [Clostridium sp. HCP1S3_A12]|uniref:HAMP domain-containing protein n=2 Tax=Clostridium TaxID=1485 RepID=UPI003F893AE5
MTIMCVIIYSVYTTRKIKKPLDNINNLLSKITEGNYDERINEDNLYEFKVISDTINYLTEKLKNSKEENKRLKDTRDRMLLDLSHDIKSLLQV